jgi:ketosteroid isomerase-like protein
MRRRGAHPYGPPMATTIETPQATHLAEALAEVFRTGQVADLFTEDVFLDGHPPYWRFQLEGRDAFAAWLGAYVTPGTEVEVARAVPTASGFVTELTGRHTEEGKEMTDRKIVLCDVRDARIAALTVYCSGDWDDELRVRHTRETTLLRP